MYKTRYKITLLLSILVSCSATVSAGQAGAKKGISVMHAYTFPEYSAAVKSFHTLNTDGSGRFMSLKVCNYSLIELFALAAGQGRVLPMSHIIVKSTKRISLYSKIGYQFAMNKSDERVLYTLMLDSLKKQFREFDVVLENKEGKNFLVIRDK